MRQDIREGVVWYIMNNIEPNFTEMGRQFNCDYRISKAVYLEVKNHHMKKQFVPACQERRY